MQWIVKYETAITELRNLRPCRRREVPRDLEKGTG